MQDIKTLGVGLHDSVFDSIVNHLYKMTCTRTSVDPSILFRVENIPVCVVVLGAAPMPGLSASKSGRQVDTAESAPPTIRQYPRSVNTTTSTTVKILDAKFSKFPFLLSVESP